MAGMPQLGMTRGTMLRKYQRLGHAVCDCKEKTVAKIRCHRCGGVDSMVKGCKNKPQNPNCGEGAGHTTSTLTCPSYRWLIIEGRQRRTVNKQRLAKDRHQLTLEMGDSRRTTAGYMVDEVDFLAPNKRRPHFINDEQTSIITGMDGHE